MSGKKVVMSMTINAISIIPGKTDYCPTMGDLAIKKKMNVSWGKQKPGDIVLFDFNRNGTSDHIGIVEKVNSNGTITTIEGNTGSGSNTNGGQVQRRERVRREVNYFIRPKYNTQVTVAMVLATARAELGVKESPKNSNKVKYNKWFYGSNKSAYWCCTFVCWVFAHVQSASTTVSKPAQTAKPASSSTNVYAGALPTKIIQLNSKGTNVVRWQKFLQWMGYNLDPDGADGVFGKNTRKYTKAAQKKFGFTGKDVDGVVGPKTIKAAKAYKKPSSTAQKTTNVTKPTITATVKKTNPLTEKTTYYLGDKVAGGLCMVSSNLYMLRRKAIMLGSTKWNTITLGGLNSQGIKYKEYSYTNDGYTYHVNKYTKFQKQTISGVKSQLISLLKTRPEGVVIYGDKSQDKDAAVGKAADHGILITSYKDGVFYGIDPVHNRNGKSKGIEKLSDTTIVTLKGVTHYMCIQNVKKNTTSTTIKKIDIKSLGKVVDISYWQSTADMAKAKKDGVDGVILRTSYTAQKKFELNIDSKFKTHFNNSVKAGLPIGAYHYSQAISESEAKKEAEYMCKILAPYKDKISLPVVCDWEFGGRLNSTSAKKLGRSGCTKVVKAFCDTVKAKGYTPMLYANYNTFKNYLNYSELKKYCLIWLAQYAKSASLDYDLWQYTSSGKVFGISGRVDMNVGSKKKRK